MMTEPALNSLAESWSNLTSLTSLDVYFASFFDILGPETRRTDDILAHLTRSALSAREAAAKAITQRTQNDPANERQ